MGNCNALACVAPGGCVETFPEGAPGQVLTQTINGPVWSAATSGVVVVSGDAGNVLIAGSDGGALITCEEIQDCIGVAIAAGAGLTYDDAMNAISSAFNIPITSGNGAPPAIANSPTIYKNNLTGEIYYRDSTGATILLTLAPAAGVTVLDTPSVDLTLTGQQIEAAVKVSALPTNALQLSPTGLFVPKPVSTDGGNLLVAGSDGGALVTCDTVQDCVGVAVNAGTGLTYDPATNAISADIVGVSDTATVDLSLGAGIITATVIVDPAPTNALVANPGGLFAPPATSTNAGNLIIPGSDGGALLLCETVQDCIGQAVANGTGLVYDDAANSLSASGVSVTVADTPTIDMNLTGSVISANAVISPNADNALIAAPNGLFAPEAVSDAAGNLLTTGADNGAFLDCPAVMTCLGTAIVDSNTVDLTVFNNTLAADVQISTDPNNCLTANPDGLYVPCPTAASLVSADPCNGIVTGTDGLLYTVNRNSLTSVRANSGEIANGNINLTGAGATAATEFPLRASITLTNPSTCRGMNVMLVCHMTGNITDADNDGEPAHVIGLDGRLYAAGAVVQFFNVGVSNELMNPADSRQYSTGAPFTVTLAAGATVTYELAGVYSRNTGGDSIFVNCVLLLSGLAVAA